MASASMTVLSAIIRGEPMTATSTFPPLLNVLRVPSLGDLLKYSINFSDILGHFFDFVFAPLLKRKEFFQATSLGSNVIYPSSELALVRIDPASIQNLDRLRFSFRGSPNHVLENPQGTQGFQRP